MGELSTKYSEQKRKRQSTYINRKPASNLYHAPRMANALNTPLNTLVTINFAHTNCPDDEISALFEDLRNKRFGPWIRRPPRALGRDRDPCAYAWVLENPGTPNAHWLLHLPEDRSKDFAATVEKWLISLGLNIHSEQAIHVIKAPKPIGLTFYLMKGINPAYADFYSVRFPALQGTVVGKRSGVSRSLGPTRKASLRNAGIYRRAKRTSWPTISA